MRDQIARRLELDRESALLAPRLARPQLLQRDLGCSKESLESLLRRLLLRPA